MVDQFAISLLQIGFPQAGAMVEKPRPRISEIEGGRPRKHPPNPFNQLGPAPEGNGQHAGFIEQSPGPLPVKIGIQGPPAFFDVDEVIEISVESRHQVGDDEALDDDVLIPPAPLRPPLAPFDPV